MLLSHLDLISLIESGVIENCPLDLVNQTTIDVTLGDNLLIETIPPLYQASPNAKLTRKRTVISLRNREKLRTHTIKMDPRKGYIMAPGEFLLAHSEQVFHLPRDLSALYMTKSSMGRIGLEHMHSGFCDPGWNGSVLTLELKNSSRYHDIQIFPGDRIGQMAFIASEEVPEEASYALVGRYNGDRTVSGVKK